jgi:octaprenyl-diphosphate synthase
MAIGAASVTDDEEIPEKMYRIGQNAGIAFQIKDDIFDYQKKELLANPPEMTSKRKKLRFLCCMCSKTRKPVNANIFYG